MSCLWGIVNIVLLVLLMYGTAILISSILISLYVKVTKKPKSDMIYLLLFNTILITISIITIIILSNGQPQKYGLTFHFNYLNISVLITIILCIIFLRTISSLYFSSKKKASIPRLDKIRLARLSIVPISEELVFRGLVQSYLYLSGCGFLHIMFLNMSINLSVPIIISSLLFVAVHVRIYNYLFRRNIFSILYAITIFIVGLILGYAREISGNLIVPILLHVFFNLLVYIKKVIF